MSVDTLAVVLNRFDAPDETRVMHKGRFEIAYVGGMSIGRNLREWSEHVGPYVGTARCPVEHVGTVVAGRATVAFDDGRVIEMRLGDLSMCRRRRTTAGWLVTSLLPRRGALREEAAREC